MDHSEEGEEELSPLWAHPVVIQKMKSQQPMAPGGNPVGPDQIVQHTTYCPYMQAKLVDLEKQFQQLPREPLVVWLLCLWDLGVDSITCTDHEMEKLVSITTHPSLHQWLQNSQ